MSNTTIIENSRPTPVSAPPVIMSFTPSLMSETTLRDIFVARQPLVDRLVRDIRDATTSNARRHALLIGPRGIGKTHLVSMVYYTVKANTDLYNKLRVAWLREEEWSVFSYADLLVRIFRALANEYPEERVELSKTADQLMRMPVAEGEAKGEAKLLEWLDGRLLLLIAENVNDLFEGMGEEGQQSLRAFLQNHSRALLLTTSPTLTSDLSAHDAPFYGYFNVTHLKELTREEARQLLTNIATIEHDDELAAYLQTDEADHRLRVIETLAGGHPRIWILFSGCMSKTLLDKLVPLFVKMLDDLTPYYQERMRALPPQERRIVAYLCEQRGAAPVKKIAEDCRLKPNAVAVLLGKLEEKGYVRKAPEPTAASVGDRRIVYYEMREPLMRLCIEVKKNRAEPLRLIVEFLRCWFREEDIKERLLSCPPDAEMTRLYMEAALERLAEVRQASDALISEGNACFDAGNFENALKMYDRVIRLEPDDAIAWYNRGLALGTLQRSEEALASFDRAIALNPDDRAWCNRGVALGRLKRSEEALASFDRAIALNPGEAAFWYNRGVALYHIERYQEALDSFDHALAIHQNDGKAHSNRVGCLTALHQFDEAQEALQRALASTLQEKDGLQSATAYVLAMLLMYEQHDRWVERVVALKMMFAEAKELPLLAYGLTQSIPVLFSETVTDTLVQKWLTAWEAAAWNHSQMDVALRLLRAAVEWKQTRDRGALLRLPAEERTVLEELLPREQTTPRITKE